jgi:arylsulfatase
MTIRCALLAGAGLLALGCISVSAQQITGVPGSPEATTTITGKQLPPADPKFGRWSRVGMVDGQADDRG